jgi:hypothetical protein
LWPPRSPDLVPPDYFLGVIWSKFCTQIVLKLLTN